MELIFFLAYVICFVIFIKNLIKNKPIKPIIGVTLAILAVNVFIVCFYLQYLGSIKVVRKWVYFSAQYI